MDNGQAAAMPMPGDTEYSQTFQQHQDYAPRQPFKPDPTPMASMDPLETSTTNRTDFVSHPVERQPAVRPSETMDHPQGPHQMETSYGQTFTQKQAERVMPIRHEKPRQEPDKFDASATYQDDFRTWSLPERPKRTQPLWLPPQESVQVTTTSQDTFKAHPPSPRDASFKPDQSYFSSSDPFPRNTENRDNFVQHAPQPLKLWRRHEPPRTPPPKFQASTTSGDAFQGAQQVKREPFKPGNEVFLSTEPLATETTSKSDYKPWTVGRRLRREPDRYGGPQGDMDFHTTSKATYMGAQPSEPRSQPTRRPSAHLLDGVGPMDGQSNYTSDFGDWKVSPREQPKPRPGYEPSTEKFVDETTTRTDFRQHELSLTESKKPDVKPLQSEEPFANSTGYRDNFVPHTLESRQPAEKAVYSVPAVPMEKSTTNRDDFRGMTGPKRSSKRPDRRAVESNEPFVDDTTSKNDFRAWPLGQRWVRQQEKYAGPQGDMDLHTTSQSEYRQFRAEKVTAKKPESAHLLDRSGDMEKTSHYNSDYGQWKTSPREPVMPRNGYEPPSEKFSGSSTTHSQFVAHNAPRMEIRRPDNKPYQSEAPFEGTSGYSQEYVKHPVEMRKPRQREGHIKPRDPFVASTTFSSDFTAKYQPKRESCRPTAQAQQSNDPFESNTTNKDSFKWNKVEPPYRHEPFRWERPEGDMDLTTVSQSQFIAHPEARRNDYIRPKSSKILCHEGKVDGTSNYASSFQSWGPQERARPKAKDPYRPNTEPFQGESTSKSQYVAHQNVERTRPVRPDQSYQPKEGSFEPSTTYGQDYKDQGVPSWLRATPKATPVNTVA